MIFRTKKFIYCLKITLLIIILDQLSKIVAYNNKQNLGSVIEIFSGLNLVYVENRGISFGFLSNLNISFYLGILSFLIGLYIIYLIKETKNLVGYISLSLILGGALGNGIDRVLNGYVIDFIDIYYGDYHWPSFNIADSSITVGGIIYFWLVFFKKSN